MMICSPCVPSLAATKKVLSSMTLLKLYTYISHTWSMGALTIIFCDVPEKTREISNE